MVEFIPPLVPADPPSPLSPTVALNPPMVGTASPFERVDGQNRDLILEAIRAWARGPLREWVEAWQGYQADWYTRMEAWLATWEQATVDYVVGKVAELTEYVDDQTADARAYVDAAVQSIINSSIQVQDPVVAGLVNNLTSATSIALDASMFRVENVRTNAQVAPAIARIVARGGGILRVPPEGLPDLNQTIVRPPQMLAFIIDGPIVQNFDGPVLTDSGSAVAATQFVTQTVTAGERTVKASPTVGLAVDDWVLIASTDVLSSTTDKIGYQRRITGIAGVDVTFDSAIPRTMADGSNRRMKKINHAPAFQVYGSGSVSFANYTTKTASMFEFLYTKGLRFSGPKLFNGPARAIKLMHVIDAIIDTPIDNFVGTLNGYGVDVAGASRDIKIRGIMGRCRHVFTTNVGPDLVEFPFYGEPENVDVDVVTYDCFNKATDTHRAGWNISIKVSDYGSNGVVQVRADNVIIPQVISHSSYGSDVVSVTSIVQVPPIIGPVMASYGSGGSLVNAASAAIVTTMPRKTGGSHSIFGGVGPVNMVPMSQISRVTVHQVVNNTTGLVDTTLSAWLEAGASYLWSAFAIYRSSTVAKAKMGVKAPAGAVVVAWTPDALDIAATTASATIRRQLVTNAGDTVTEASLGSAGAGVDVVATPSGRVVNGPTAGYLVIQFAQSVGVATDTALRVGSSLRVDKIDG